VPNPQAPEKFERPAVRWHVRFVHETKNVELRESLASLLSSPPFRPIALRRLR